MAGWQLFPIASRAPDVTSSSSVDKPAMASNGVGGRPSFRTAGSDSALYSLPSMDSGVIVWPASDWLRKSEFDKPDVDEMEHAEDRGAEGHEHEKQSLLSSLAVAGSAISWSGRVAQPPRVVMPTSASGCGM